jgi:hypothetical protein
MTNNAVTPVTPKVKIPDFSMFELNRIYVQLNLNPDIYIPDNYNVVQDFKNFLAKNPKIDLQHCFERFAIKISSRTHYNNVNIEKIFPIYDYLVKEKKLNN